MHPLLTIASAAAGIYSGLRLARYLRGKKHNGGGRKPTAAENSKAREPRNLGELKHDPKSGIYRPTAQ